MAASSDRISRRAKAPWLALGAAAGPILLTLAWLLLGELRAGYSAIAQQISDLGVGERAGWMNVAFVLTALIQLTGVAAVVATTRSGLGGTARAACFVLLAISPAGGVIVGFFTEAEPARHVIGASLALILPVVAFPAAGVILRRSGEWRRMGTALLVAGALTLPLAALALATRPHGPLSGRGFGGLAERVLLLEIQAWYVVLGWIGYRRGAVGQP